MSKRVDYVKSVKDLNESDLKARIQEDELRLKKLSFAHAISPLENPMSIRELRKDISRLKTFLGQKTDKVAVRAASKAASTKAPAKRVPIRYTSKHNGKAAHSGKAAVKA
jgi:large subunit ribosomal protein L29